MFPASPRYDLPPHKLSFTQHASHALSPTTCQGANSAFCALDLHEHVLVVCTGDVVATLLTAILSKERRPEPIIGGAVSKKPLSVEELELARNFRMVIKFSVCIGTAEFFGAHSTLLADLTPLSRFLANVSYPSMPVCCCAQAITDSAAPAPAAVLPRRHNDRRPLGSVMPSASCWLLCCYQY